MNSTIYKDGFHWKNPFLDKVVKFDIQTQKEQTQALASSKDLQRVTCDVAINFEINEDSVTKLFKEVGTMSDIKFKIIDPLIQEVMKASTAKFTAEELITRRSEVSKDTITELQNGLIERGIKVTALNIINFQFSEDFNNAIEAKVKAEQDALTQKNKLEQVKYEAEQRVAQATAEAQAIKIQAQAVMNQWGAGYVSLKWIEKRDGKLPVTTLGQNTSVYFPMAN